MATRSNHPRVGQVRSSRSVVPPSFATATAAATRCVATQPNPPGRCRVAADRARRARSTPPAAEDVSARATTRPLVPPPQTWIRRSRRSSLDPLIQVAQASRLRSGGRGRAVPDRLDGSGDSRARVPGDGEDRPRPGTRAVAADLGRAQFLGRGCAGTGPAARASSIRAAAPAVSTCRDDRRRSPAAGRAPGGSGAGRARRAGLAACPRHRPAGRGPRHLQCPSLRPATNAQS